MADEHSRMEASQALADQLGPAAAAALMECIPPFGWHEIATKSDLARLEDAMNRRFGSIDDRFASINNRFDSFEERLTLRLDAQLSRSESRLLRWTVGAIFAGFAALGTGIAVVAALVG